MSSGVCIQFFVNKKKTVVKEKISMSKQMIVVVVVVKRKWEYPHNNDFQTLTIEIPFHFRKKKIDIKN